MIEQFKEIKFDEFVRLKRGYDLPNTKMIPGAYPVVASTEIKGFHNQYKTSPPAVVTGRSGSLGTVQYITTKCWPLNTSLYVKDFKGNHPKYVYYILKMMHLENFNSGAGVPTLNQNHLHNQKIRVHKTFDLQLKVSEILSTYDNIIENNTKRISILEQMAEQIYKEWFVRMRFSGYEKAKFIKGVPEGWEVKTIKDFGRVVTGKTPSTKVPDNYGGEMPFIKTPDMHGNMFLLQTDETLTNTGADTQKSQLIPANSISVSCIGTGGVVAMTTKDSMTNQQINSLIISDMSHREYLYFTLKNLKATIELFGATGATMTNLSKGKFEKLLILAPCIKVVEDYHKLTYPIFEEIKNLGLQVKQLKQSRNLLLPRLISGKLSVEQTKHQTQEVS